MKNIQFVNSSNDGASTIFIDDLDKLDPSKEHHKEVREAIECVLNHVPKDPNNSLDRAMGKFGQYFHVIYGEIVDEGGYLMHNILHEVYGFTENPYTVEHQVYCKSDI